MASAEVVTLANVLAKMPWWAECECLAEEGCGMRAGGGAPSPKCRAARRLAIAHCNAIRVRDSVVLSLRCSVRLAPAAGLSVPCREASAQAQ
jgi:hypothetical protein